MNGKEVRDKLKLFGMQNLMLETSLSKLEESGMEIGHVGTLSKQEIVDNDLFEMDIRMSAQRMADFYVVYYCFENSVRRLISGTLSEKYGANWWDTKVPEDIKREVKEKEEKEKDSVMSIRSEDPLSYTNFGELIPIIEMNWTDFADRLRSKKGVTETLGKFNQVRNVIAHSCELKEDEIIRLKLIVKDWLRLQN